MSRRAQSESLFVPDQDEDNDRRMLPPPPPRMAITSRASGQSSSAFQSRGRVEKNPRHEGRKKSASAAIAGPSEPRQRQPAAPLDELLSGRVNILLHDTTGNKPPREQDAHPAMLAHESPYLRKAIYSDSTGEARPEIKLDVDPDTFIIWLWWCSSKSIKLPTVSSTASGSSESPFGLLLDLYILGWKFQSPAFMNDVLIEICKHANNLERVFTAAEVARIYRTTPAEIPLRRLAVDQWACDLDADSLNWAEDRAAPPEFFHQCFKRKMKMAEAMAKSKGRWYLQSPDMRPKVFMVRGELPPYSTMIQVKVTVGENGKEIMDLTDD